jgi:hypothetical protein
VVPPLRGGASRISLRPLGLQRKERVPLWVVAEEYAAYPQLRKAGELKQHRDLVDRELDGVFGMRQLERLGDSPIRSVQREDAGRSYDR